MEPEELSMTFRVAARTLLHLGAELISSDGIAFYELVKNGLDAGSRVVRLEVMIALPQPSYRDMREHILGRNSGRNPSDNGNPINEVSLEAMRSKACQAIDSTAPTAPEALELLRATDTYEQLYAA